VSTVAVIPGTEDSDHTEEKESDVEKSAAFRSISPDSLSAAVAQKVGAPAVEKQYKREFKPTERTTSDDGNEADREDSGVSRVAPPKRQIGKYFVDNKNSDSEGETMKIFEVKNKPEPKLHSPRTDPITTITVPLRRPVTASAAGSITSNDRYSSQASYRDEYKAFQRPMTAGAQTTYNNANTNSSAHVGVLVGPPLAAIMKNSPRRTQQKTYVGLNTDSTSDGEML